MIECKEYVRISPFEEPVSLLTEWRRNGQLNNEGIGGNNSLMKDSEIAFLCGLIKDTKPKKIVEVGVAAGGTSAVILNCLHMLDLDTQMYSVDLAENYYNGNEKSGYLVYQAAASGIDISNHHMMLGKVVAERIEEIGGEIDFLILDTMHCLPGEVLDFLALFPYLTPDAVVVLHDVRRHFYVSKSYATNILFNTVTADKYIDNSQSYPNIAAFKINEDTPKYILDVFAGLMMPWYYLPSDEMMAAYESVLCKNYPESFMKLYEQAKDESKRLLERQQPYMELKSDNGLTRFENILLYGTNDAAEITIKHLRDNNLEVSGYVVSDGFRHPEELNGLPVYSFSEIPYATDNTLILLTSISVAPFKTLSESKYHWARIRLNEF